MYFAISGFAGSFPYIVRITEYFLKISKMSHFQAVLFDMDGVLIDSEPVHNLKWCEVLKDHNIHIDIASLIRYTGVPDKEIAEEFVSTFRLGKSPVELVQIKQKKYRQFLEAGIVPAPELTAAIKSLTKYKLGLVTASCKTDAEMVCDGLGIRSLFDIIVGGDEIIRNKPHPDIYLTATGKLNIHPAYCIAIEDSPYGVIAAKRAGLFVIAVTNQLHNPGLAEADHVCDNTLQAIDYIRSIN